MKTYPTSFQAADIVILDEYNKRLLLGSKSGSFPYRFIGGFVDVKDKSLEQTAYRERREEAGTNLVCTDPVYLFSFRVDDIRYKKKKDKIMSAVFLCNYLWGYPTAGDDILGVEWFLINRLNESYKKSIDKAHWPIVEGLIERKII